MAEGQQYPPTPPTNTVIIQAAPRAQLAQTGSDVSVPLAAGAGLILAGVLLVASARVRAKR